MSEFKYFEDFNKEVQDKLLTIGLQEAYIIKIKIEKHENLEAHDRNSLCSKCCKKSSCDKKSCVKFKKYDEIIKLYSSVSFHYIVASNDVQCTQMSTNSKLFDGKIFFPIPFSEFKSIFSEYQEKTWHWNINEENSIIIIAKIDKEIDSFKKNVTEIFKLHKDYDSNSLNAINISMKKLNDFIEQFEDSGGFDPSLEITLSNVIKYIFNKFRVKNKVSLISLFKLITDSDYKLAWKKHELRKEENLAFDEKEFEETISNKISTHYFEENISYAILKELPLPIGFSDQKGYYLVIPITKSKGRVQFRYTMILMGTKPFETYILNNITGLLSKYYSSYLKEQKSNLLLELQKALFERNIEPNNNVKKCLIKLIEKTFKTVVQITDAYSATFRLFNPATRKLKKVVNEANKEGNAYPTDEDDKHKYIDVDKNKRKSLNCRAFWLQEGEKCASYVSNIPSTKKNMHKKDKYYEEEFSTLQSRSQTLSELCVPFYYQDVVIGVMNFESPILYAFDDECEYEKINARVRYHKAINMDKYVILCKNSFIYMVKSTLQHFYSLMEERNDIKHLSRFIERENNLHELKNLVETEQDLNQFKEQIRNILNSVTTLSTFCNNSSTSIKQKLVEMRTDYAERYYSKVGSFSEISKEDFMKPKHLHEYLPIKIEEDKHKCLIVNSQTANRLEAIYRNLLRNYFTHGDPKDKLSAIYIKAKNLLILRQEFDIPLKPNSALFISPHMSKKGTSSGLFIVGTHVRQLGGYVFAQYDENERLKCFDIYIYLKQEGEKNEEC
jgi:hypothetical protein